MEINGFKDTIRWYDDNADAYAENAKKVSFEQSIEAFLSRLPAHPRVLEAGCGTGRDARVFRAKGAEVTGVDISEGLIAVARKENPDISFVSSSFLSLPFGDASFDGVWSHASLVHLETVEEVRQALAEFYRVTKPGGFLYVYVKQQQGEEKTAIVSDSLSNHDRFFRYYTPGEMAGLLAEAGFTVGEPEFSDDPHGRTEVKWIQFTVQKPAEDTGS